MSYRENSLESVHNCPSYSHIQKGSAKVPPLDHQKLNSQNTRYYRPKGWDTSYAAEDSKYMQLLPSERSGRGVGNNNSNMLHNKSSRADEVESIEERINSIEDRMMVDNNEMFRRMIIFEEQLKGLLNTKNIQGRFVEQEQLHKTTQRVNVVENKFENFEKKLDRVSLKLKEIIRYLNEKATSRRNRRTPNNIIYEEMKKMSDTLVNCINFQSQVKNELDTLKRDRSLSARTERQQNRKEYSYDRNDRNNEGAATSRDYSQSYLNHSDVSDVQQYSQRDVINKSGSEIDMGLKQSIYDKIKSIKRRKEQIQRSFGHQDQRSKTAERVERVERVESYSRKRGLDQLEWSDNGEDNANRMTTDSRGRKEEHHYARRPSRRLQEEFERANNYETFGDTFEKSERKRFGNAAIVGNEERINENSRETETEPSFVQASYRKQENFTSRDRRRQKEKPGGQNSARENQQNENGRNKETYRKDGKESNNVRKDFESSKPKKKELLLDMTREDILKSNTTIDYSNSNDTQENLTCQNLLNKLNK